MKAAEEDNHISSSSTPNMKPEVRPPLLKKSRTISTDDTPPTHFPGPLFPAVRRISTSPPPPIPLPSSTTFSDQRFGVSDRDYVYPSFLGPYSSRTRVTVKSSPSKQPQKSFDPPGLVVNSPARTTSMPSLLDASRDFTTPESKHKSKLKQERDLKSVPVQILANTLTSNSSLSTSDSPSLTRTTSAFKNSFFLNLLKFVCIVSVSYAISLQSKVTKLQEENVRLGRMCSLNENVYIDKTLESQNERLFVYFRNTGSREIALYVVLFTLLIPFVLYKFLDDLPRIKNISKATHRKEEVPLKKRIAYMVDVCFSVYPYAKLLALLFATIFLIGFGGLALYAVSDASFSEALWLSWSFVADSGNHADRVGTGPRIVSVSISAGGMLIFAMMLGLVSDAISEKVDSLRKGKSEVIENNHILILGWSDKLGSLLKQLTIANKSIGGGVIVVLSERDKEDMEMDIAKLEFDFMGTSVICRSGSPLILADLKKVSVSKARAIIVLASDENADQIWEDILGFENAEFYIKRWPKLDGLHFEEVLVSFPDAIPCGIKVAADGGKIILNPDDKYVLKEGDEVIVIAEDDDTYAPGPIAEVQRGLFPKISDPPKYPEKILFCGWRRDIDDMIMVLEALLAPGSELWMFNEVLEKEREKKLIDGGLDVGRLENIKLIHREGNAVIKRHLENLPLETFDSILILADESVEDSIVHSDSRSLATLLLIRDIQSKRLPYKDRKSMPLRHSGFSHSSWIREMQQASDKSIIISEILDSRTRNLVSVTRISDYVLSNELVSMALAMVAEDKQINRVLEELFAEEGSEMCIKPSEFYLYDQEELCFYDIMIRGRQRDEIVIGYRLATAERAVINPVHKSETRKWSIDDVFVVISLGE
ncbi:putative ion channel SYM8 isoform X2 [Apium graveolens]|uniref:putative ion channel SYM8 isoform X2 n=1 Tax=Apium graveolens TaxID=4045 RepID=UPI003D7A4B08